MTDLLLEEFFETLPPWQATELAREVQQYGWYPQTVVLVYLTTSAQAIFSRPIREISVGTINTVERWCKENCLKNWRNYTDYYWLFESKKEAIYFKTVWG